MSFTGMDIAEVHQLAAHLTNASNQIRSVSQSLTAQLHNTTWVGPDREQFINDWQSVHVAQLNHVAEAIDQAATRANQNAQQQEAASNS